MEQIRIVKEMRDRDKRSGGHFSQHPRPRYMVWENVCFDADTLVACDTGYKRIADITAGTKVKTRSGRYMPVAKVHKTEKQEVMKLSVSGGEDLYVTPNHPFLARSGRIPNIKRWDIMTWLPAEKLSEHWLIAYRVDVPTLPDDFIKSSDAYQLGTDVLNNEDCIPQFIFELSRSLQANVLAGLTESFLGTTEKLPEITARNRELAYGIARLIRNVYRVPVDISKTQIRERNFEGAIPAYKIKAVADEQEAFYDGEFIWQPVKSIERVDGKRTVYNLSVYEDNTYGANDVVVHNCGAFSSNKGADFQAVLSEIVKIVEPEADDVPMPQKGKWPHAGCLYDEMGGWSIAWRVHDAQFWGVPQRRKRIALVADFGGLSAPEVLLERKGMLGDPQESGTQGEGTPTGTESGPNRSISFQERAGKPGGGKGILIQNERVGTLSTLNNQSVFRMGEENTDADVGARTEGFGETGIGYWQEGIQTLRAEGENRPSRPGNVVVENHEPGKCLNPWDVQSKRIQPSDGVADALWAGEKRFGGGESYVMQEETHVSGIYENDEPARLIKEKCPSLTTGGGKPGQSYPCVLEEKTLCYGMDNERRRGPDEFEEQCPTLTSRAGTGGNNVPCVVPEKSWCLQGNGIDRADTAGCNGKGWCEDVSYTLNTIDRPAVYTESEVQEPIPINTMGGTRTTEEKRTAFGVGEPGDPEFTLSAAHSHAVFSNVRPESGAYGFEPGAAQRLNPESRFFQECAPTLRANMGDNQVGVVCLNDQGGSVMNVSEDVSGTLRAEEHGHQPVITMNPRPQSMVCSENLAATLGADDYKEPQMVYDARGNGDGCTVPTLTGDHQNRITDYTAICLEKADTASGYAKNGTQEAMNGMYVMQGFGDYKDSEQASACKARDYKDATDLVVGTFQNTGHGWWNESDTGASVRCASGGREANIVAAVDCRNGSENPDTNGTLQAKSKGGQSLNYQNVCRIQNTVRRLTPLECTRLQGYPDGWVDIGDWTDQKGKVHKENDSTKYKALGNSIALPFWFYLLRRISAQYERRATLGSLFDGISGFPLCWIRCNGTGSALWTSEIEPFPIAVAKKHFGDEDAGTEGDIAKYL